ncbi:probable ubiquitin-like-specific protease 2B [Oryza glaberrima]|uniref:probable ubiquitin-like-specific protease 2B n=1 Tax=Oryza glaberrima TaxID=4538 RepID=UPI00224C604B|nr:probable ubiquitin-like-specific protease 2B [Oryza glaberrima]
MNQPEGSSHETNKLDAVMSASTMHSDHNNANACVDDYQHTKMMAGIQPMEEVGFGCMQPFELQSQGIVPDSEEESLPSSPETSSTSNYDMPDLAEQNLEHIYNVLGEMVDKEGPVVLSPEYVMCSTTSHVEPRLTFSADGFKIEYWDSCENDEMAAQYWKISDITCIDCKWAQSVGSVLITLHVGSGTETGNSSHGRIQFCLIDSQWPRKQQNIWHLASRYQEIWNSIPSGDFASENWNIEPSLFFPKQYFSDTEEFEDVIYPKGDHDAVSISKRDVELLLPETFVNDTIIDFYVKHLSTRIEPAEKHRYHFFNSFFFRKLADLDKDQGRAPEGRAAFLRVRKWTRKINIFAKEFLFIPVNFNLHWSLIVICYPGEVETFKDGDTNISAKIPCILHMDSLKGSHSGLKDIIQSYLWEEWKERHPESASDCSDKFLNLRFISLELPQQDNSFDCGLFLLHYVELFLTDTPRSFNPLKIDSFANYLSDDWFPPAEASLKRSLIRKLIHKLLKEPSQDFPKLVCCSEQLDKTHGSENAELEQMSENAEREQAKELPAQMCTDGEPDSVGTILETQQPSISTCFNDSDENGPPVSVHNPHKLEVSSANKDAIVCLSNHDEKNESPPADSYNHLDLRSCDSEEAETAKGSAGVVKDPNSHKEPLLDSLDNNQDISIQAGAEMHDSMDSKLCSISNNADLMASEERSLDKNTKENEEHNRTSEDIVESVMMLGGSKSDTELDAEPERTAGEAEVRNCDHSKDIDYIALGDINKDAAKQSLNRNIVEAEDIKCEGTLVDHTVVEDATPYNVNETSASADKINDNEHNVSSELKEGNNGNGITTSISCEMEDRNIDNLMVGDSRNGTDETRADGQEAHDNSATAETVPCEDNATTSITDAEMPHEDSTCSVKGEAISDNTASDAKRPLPDSTYIEDIPDDKCLQKDDGGGDEAKTERHYKRRKFLVSEATS